MGLGPGTQLGTNIVLERPLGEGAMGEVWIAENRALSSKVAVKVLHQALTDDEEALSRFQQEARAIANIDNPHVVRIFDFGTTPEGEPYIVMELMSGHDLRELIEMHGRLPVDKTATIVRQLCSALGRAHQLGVIHRDIKPANVFITEVDGEPFVKILDFGIARIHRDAHMDMTETGAVMGTPYYMSPEQFVDPRRIDHRSDLWSVAVVTYGCLMGTLPFLGETIGALSLAVHGGSFARPSEIDASLPVALDAFFERALQVDPGRRYATARELSEAFAAACGSAPSSHAPHLAAAARAPSHGAHVSAPSIGGPTAATHVPSSVPASTNHGAHAGAPVPTAPAGPHGGEHIGAMMHTNPAAAPAPTASTFTQTGAAPPPRRSGSTVLIIGVVLAVLGVGALVTALVLPSLESEEVAAAESPEDDASSGKKTGKKKKKKKKGKKREADDGDDADGDEADAVAPAPAPSAESSASTGPVPSAPAPASTPSPAPKPAPAPKPKPIRYASTGNACWAYKNKSCPSAQDCCGRWGGTRDIPQYQEIPGKDRGRCMCMRPVCGPGENWSTHKCKMQ